MPCDVARVVAHVHARLTDDALNADAVCRDLRLCSGARARFRLATGASLKGFIERERMALAARLLVETDAPVGGIAFEVGYRSHEVFTRAFTRVVGVAPSAYRRDRQAENASGIVKTPLAA